MSRMTLMMIITVGALSAWAGGLFDREIELPSLPSIEVTTQDSEILEQVRAARSRLEASPRDARANWELGALYELYQRPEGSRICYLRASLLDPRALQWTYHLGRVEQTFGDPVAAVAALERAVSIEPYPPALALLGQAYMDSGDLEAAKGCFDQILQRNPRSCSGLLGLGRILAERGDHAGAVGRYNEALSVAPRHGPLHYAAGISRRALGDEEVARQHFEFAQENGPANPDPDRLLAEVMRLRVGATQDFGEASRLVQEGQAALAVPILNRILGRDPDHAAAQALLAKAQMSLGDPSAIREYERAVELNPSNIDILRPYALLLLRGNAHAAAERYMKQVIQLGGDHADDHHILGVTFLKQNRLMEARTSFERALERDPQHAEARQGLQATYQ